MRRDKIEVLAMGQWARPQKGTTEGPFTGTPAYSHSGPEADLPSAHFDCASMPSLVRAWR